MKINSVCLVLIVLTSPLLLSACGSAGGPSGQSQTQSQALSVSSPGALSDLLISQGTLGPTFNSNIGTYNVTLANGTASITMTPTISTNYLGATITVNGTTVSSGSASPLSLSEGENPVTIVVTSMGGVIQTYGVNVAVNGPSGFGSVDSFSASGQFSYPYGGIVLGPDGHTFYGAANSDGANGAGTVFKVSVDGSSSTDLYDFNDASITDPQDIQCDITVSTDGATLYGTTTSGGMGSDGTVFSLSSSGGAFTVLHNFSGGVNDGSNPSRGSLILSGNILYGMTVVGGANGDGTIYSIKTDGTGFALLHSFGPTNGADPAGALTLVNNRFYGMTQMGGPNNCNGPACGTIFTIGVDGSGFQVLHNFTVSDGSDPMGTLLYVNNTLYGMAKSQGANNLGTVFSMGDDGSNFTVMHNFAGGTTDGENPYGTLAVSADQTTLYGQTPYGGSDNNGVIFSLPIQATTSTPINIVHNFTSSTVDGGNPFWGSVVVVGTTLFGMTQNGGGNDAGFIYSYGL